MVDVWSPRNASETVGVTAVMLCQEVLPGQRKFVNIINTSSAGQNISLGINQDPVNGAGIVLAPGGNYSDSADGTDYFPPHFSIWAISDAAGGTVAIFERLGATTERVK